MSTPTPEVRWHKHRRDQLAEIAPHGAVLLLPIGSIEQHGPHLPIDTDTNAVVTVATRAAKRLSSGNGTKALVLPEISWGLSPYWMPFTGTITLRPETILALIRDIGASVAEHGFRRLVIVNGHGGNAGIIAVAATALAEYGIRAAALSYWDLIREEMREWEQFDGGLIGHAGEAETGIARYLQLDLVTEPPSSAECADLSAMAADPFFGTGYRAPDPLRESPTGVYGNAQAGTAELGAKIIETAAERLAEFVQAFASDSSER